MFRLRLSAIPASGGQRVSPPQPPKEAARHFFLAYFNGICFRTACRACNSKLGGSGDRILSQLYSDAKRFISSPIFIGDEIHIRTKPNLLYRSALAQFLLSNDCRPPSSFDDAAKVLLSTNTIERSTAPNFYLWRYSGPDLLIVRDMVVSDFAVPNSTHTIQVIKLAPFGMMLTDAHYPGLLNLRRYIQPNDDIEATIRIDARRSEAHPFWPAYAEGNKVLLLGDSMQIYATKSTTAKA